MPTPEREYSFGACIRLDIRGGRLVAIIEHHGGGGVDEIHLAFEPEGEPPGIGGGE